MLDYSKSYLQMDDEQLLRLASQWLTLTEPAQESLAVELEKRKLRTEFESARRIALEKAATSKTSVEKASTLERTMFWLFILGGIFGLLLMPRAYPYIFNVRSPRLEGLYEIVEGVCDCFPLWLIIWLIVRAKRVRREIQG
jgi:hypothetical protein